MAAEVERLARRAATGDLSAARMLVALLEGRDAAVTTPDQLESKRRAALIEKIEGALRNSHAPHGTRVTINTTRQYAEEVAAAYERAGWFVILSDDSVGDGESFEWELMLSSDRP